jgi:hypothetical protein
VPPPPLAGPNHNDYVDSYSAELSNELEPTGPYACAYRRPGVACGAWGMYYVNLLGMLVDAARDLRTLDESVVVVELLQPVLGQEVGS